MFTKEEIIRELQKLAKENGGKTPSENVFVENTRVGIYDRMRYWPNYGELVREAGLTPNKFDKTKYNRDQLCEIFIGFIREKRRWPTRGDLDVKHFNDPTFPHSQTFYRELGLTGDLIQTILEYVEGRKGFEDIVNACNSALERFKIHIEEFDGKVEGKLGWVYLFKHGQYNHYRIGRTSDLLRRGSEIRIQLPERAVLIHSIKTVDPEGIETYWLNRFKLKQMNGDWFKLSRAEVKEFKRWKKIV